MLCQKSLHDSCRMGRRIVVMKLICLLGHCECDRQTVHKLSQRNLTADLLLHGRVTVHGCTMGSPLTGCQVTSRPRDWFLRYSKWMDTFRTALIFCFMIILKYPTFISTNNANEKVWSVLAGLH